MISLVEHLPDQRLWYAKLELGFQAQTERTVLAHRRHFGPVRVQKMPVARKNWNLSCDYCPSAWRVLQVAII